MEQGRPFRTCGFVGILWLILIAAFLGTIARAADLPKKLVGHGGPVKAISISADGKNALTASFDYSIIYWELAGEEGIVRHRLIGHNGAVNDVAFVPNSNRAVSVSDDGSLGIWDLEKGELITLLQGEVYKVLDVAVSEDGNLAATARWNSTVQIYDLKKMKKIANLKGHRGNVNSVVFSNDGKRLYSAAYDGQIIEWEVDGAKMIRPIFKNGWGINSIARIDNTRLIFGAINGAVGIIDIENPDKMTELSTRKRPVQSVKVSGDGAMVGIGDGAGTIEVFRTKDFKKVEEANVAFGPVWDFDFIPGSSQAYHVGLDDFAIRWRVAPRDFSQIESKFPRRFQLSDSNDPGELEFQRKCSVCHTLTPNGANRAGPTLYALFGRKAGTLPGYKYSKALLGSDVIWNEQTIARLFDDGPDIMMPGTKMPIQRLKSVSRRDDLVDYLKRATAPKPQVQRK